MTVQVGILGLGFMGNMHRSCYDAIRGATVAALCDTDPKRLTGVAHVEGNIQATERKKPRKAIQTYCKPAELYKDPQIDVIDITLPTPLHAACVIRALKAGKHVICEKPMAVTSTEARSMIAAAKKAKKNLFVAHCIRFWPAYVKAKELVDSGRWGKVHTAVFTRLSATPEWSWNNWLQNSDKSGSVALDLHIHDADYVLHLFGKPKSVTSHGGGVRKGRLDHITTRYEYNKDMLVTAEGAWEYAPGFGFSMTFRIAMDGATLLLEPDGKLMLHPRRGKSRAIRLSASDGYVNELKHFTDCIARGRASTIVPPQSALQSVQLIEAEVQSVRTGKRVPVRF